MRLKKLLLVITLLLAYCTPGFSQACDTVFLPDSFVVCRGDYVQLLATVRGSIPVDSVSWIPAGDFSDPHALKTTLRAWNPGYYKCIVMSPGFANMISNGDFSAGNTDFTSMYKYEAPAACAICPEGNYTVATRASSVYGNGPCGSFGDHTTGSGNFLLANGNKSVPIVVWSQTVNVKPATWYRLEGWQVSWNNDAGGSLPPPIIRCDINGVLVGADTNFYTVGIWKHFQFDWASTGTTAKIDLSDRNVFATGNDFGIDDLTFREKNACADTDSVLISFIPSPTINAGPDRRILQGDTININATGTLIQSIRWDPSPALSCDNCLNPVITAVKSESFLITVTAYTGCTDKDTVNITVYCDGSRVFVPNTFTPNGDGYNDIFYPRGKGVGTITSFSIFNRQGQLVYEKDNIELNDISAGWNGNYKGAVLRPDQHNGEFLRPETFVYVIEASCASGDPVIIKGDVNLVR